MLLQLTSSTDQSRADTLAAPAELGSPFRETERAFHRSLGGLAADAQGREVLVGLTFDETLFYLAFIRAFGRERTHDPQIRDRHRSLRKRYELARDGAW